MYYGPPPPRHQSWLPWIVAAVLAVFIAVCGVIVLARATAGSGGVRFTPAETKFLGSVRRSGQTPEFARGRPWVSWPEDSELVGEGHAACSALADTGGNREQVVSEPIVGKPMMPAFMERYPYDQRVELVGAAVENLCTEYAIWVGGLPI